MKKILLILLALVLMVPSIAVEAAAKGKVLLVASSTDTLALKDGKIDPTGYFLDELTVPTMRLLEEGYEVVLATPKGDIPVMDKVSNNVGLFYGSQAALDEALDFVQHNPIMLHPIKIKDAIAEGLEQYVAVYVPGGHAPMNDLMQDKDFGKVLRHFHENGKPTAFLCHGPIASLAALDDPVGYRKALVSGTFDEQAEKSKNWQYAGYRMTIYSNAEEYSVEEFVLKGKLPFYVADALQIAGGIVEHAPLNQGHVVRDRELITGQNPASDHMIAEELVKALAERK